VCSQYLLSHVIYIYIFFFFFLLPVLECDASRDHLNFFFVRFFTVSLWIFEKFFVNYLSFKSVLDKYAFNKSLPLKM